MNAMDPYAPILQQINRQGDLLLTADAYARQRDALEEQRRRNSLLEGMELYRLRRDLERENALQQLMHGLDFSTADPDRLMELGRAIGTVNPQLGIGLIQKAVEQKTQLAKIREDSGLVGDAKSLATVMGRTPTVEELLDFKRKVAEAGAPKMQMQMLNEKENTLVKKGLDLLPETKKEAVASRQAIDRIDQALGILEKHGSDVVGIPGKVRRWLAPFAKTVGMDAEKASDAEILHALLTAGAGSLRTQVVGPGPVSNYEQQILQSVSGGRMSYAEGVKEILRYHRAMNQNKIDEYNEQVEAISSIPGYEKTRQVFRPISYKPMKAAPHPAVAEPPAPTLQPQSDKGRIIGYGIERSTGRRVVKYDDGTPEGRIEYAD